MSLDVAGNFSMGLPVFNDTRGRSFSSLAVNWLLATRAMLFALLGPAVSLNDLCWLQTFDLHSFRLDLQFGGGTVSQLFDG